MKQLNILLKTLNFVELLKFVLEEKNVHEHSQFIANIVPRNRNISLNLIMCYE